MTSPVRESLDSAGILTITLSDPERHNALGEHLVEALTNALRAAHRPDTKVVVLTAVGETFSAGAPRELLRRLARGEVAPTDILLTKTLLDVPVPVIAAMAGHATGGGLALGLAADIVLLAKESRYGLPFVDLGFTPGMGTTRLLEHVLSPAIAHELLFTGELRKGSAFVGTSGINYVVPRAEVEIRAGVVAARIADKPRLTLATLKRTLSLPRRLAFEETLTYEALMHEVTFAAAETRRRIEENYVE